MGLPGSASSAWPDDDIDRARDRLPSESFTQAWARGRETPLDEVAELVPLPASTPDGAKPHPAIAVPAGSVSAATGTATSERAPMGSAMTPRERQVAELVALGLTNSEIAERLGITTGTARIHIERILSKLGLNSRVQIATWIVRNAPEPPVEARRN
jgi:non-specific serine/threonine protein kinase